MKERLCLVCEHTGGPKTSPSPWKNCFLLQASVRVGKLSQKYPPSWVKGMIWLFDSYQFFTLSRPHRRLQVHLGWSHGFSFDDRKKWCRLSVDVVQKQAARWANVSFMVALAGKLAWGWVRDHRLIQLHPLEYIKKKCTRFHSNESFSLWDFKFLSWETFVGGRCGSKWITSCHAFQYLCGCFDPQKHSHTHTHSVRTQRPEKDDVLSVFVLLVTE